MLERINPDQEMDESAYRERLKKAQHDLGELGWMIYQRKIPVIILYEGWDAGGKGGNIRRLVEPLDPRGYKVHPIAAPKGAEAEHHYLWRFWKRLPPMGEIAIFDRTWYGRVLVERVEGFAQPAEWKRAYREINHFEQQLVDFGAIMLKFWIHISMDEQLARFEARKQTPWKQWKLTDEDWRNREKWPLYQEAVEEMLLKTSTHHAPWTIIEGNNKKYARVKTIETAVETIGKAVKVVKAK